MNGQCNNPHCGKDNIPGTKYCSMECEIKYLNSIRLAFWPEPRDESEKEIVELNSRASIIALQSWDKLTTEQKMFKINLLQDASIQLMVMVYAEKNRDEIQARADSEQALRIKTRKSIHERQELAQAIVESDRIKTTLKKQGEKLSSSGKCEVCEIPSLKKHCSQRCKSIASFMNTMKATKEIATQMVDLMQQGLTPTSDPIN